jgi:hypothetical protein
LTISSPYYKDLEGLELLFHEVSHATFFEQRILSQLSEAFKRHDAQPSDLLTHLIQFVTPAEILRSELRGEQRETFRAVGDAVIERGPMRPMAPALRRHWKAFLDGEIDRATAFDRLASELAPKPR